MKRLQLGLIFIFYASIASGQDAESIKTELMFGAGIAKLFSTDQLLNYYNYKSDIYLPVNFTCSFSIHKNLFTQRRGNYVR